MTDKTPYGASTTYADPGYQSDGVKRYPIDTAEHVRAAWSYINVVSNARKYTASQLAQIRSRIMTAAKKFGIDVHAEDAAEFARLRNLYESSAAKKRRKHAYAAPSRGWIGSPVCLTCGLPKNDPDHDGDVDAPGVPDTDSPPATQQAGGPVDDNGVPNGCMVAFYPSPALAQQLAVEGGEPADDLHVTLAFLGTVPAADQLEQLKTAVSTYAQGQAPVDGVISGIGTFTAGEQPVTYASIDCPTMPAFRQGLVDALTTAGFPPDDSHGFTPHMSIAYADLSGIQVPNSAVDFGIVWVVAGVDRYGYTLNATPEAAALKQQPHSAGYDAETQIIKVNKAHPNSAKRHAFRPSEVPTTQGDPRCLMCGASPPPANGLCNTGSDAVMDVRPGPTVVPIAAADDATDAAKTAAGIDAGVDQALVLLRSCKNEDLLPYAQQARDLLQGIEAACDELLDYFGVADPDDTAETAADYGQHSVVKLGDDWAVVDGGGTVVGRYETVEEANRWLDAARKRLSLPVDPEFQEGEEPSDILAGDPKDEAPKAAPGLQNPWTPYAKTASAAGTYTIPGTFTFNPVTTATTTTSLFRPADINAPSASELRAYLQDAANLQPGPATSTLPRTTAFVAEINGKTILTTEASVELADAMTDHDHYLWTSGRLVGADEPNRNGAFWSSGDLELGQTTVPYGPLNWLHEEKHVIGSIAAASYSQPSETSGLGTMPNHIAIAAPIWRWLYPDEAAVVEMASDTGKLHFCVDDETEIMTGSGWKHFADLSVGEDILTLDRSTRLSRWTPTEKIFEYDLVDEDMVRMEGQQHSSLTTPHHRWFVDHRIGTGNHEWVERTSSNLRTVDYIPKALPYGEFPTTAKYDDDFVDLVAWAFTDAGLQRGAVTVHQSQRANPDNVSAIDAMFTRLGLDVRRREYMPGIISWGLHTGGSEPVLGVMAHASISGRVPGPEFIRALTRTQLQSFVDVCMAADGTVHHEHGQRVFYAENEDEIRLFEMACALLGQTTNSEVVTVEEQLRYRRWEPQFLNGVEVRVNKPIWRCCLVRRGGNKIAPKRLAGMGNGFIKDVVSYTGKVWCPSTPDETFLARRRGTVYWTMNSMECISKEVACVGDGGCGAQVPYGDYIQGTGDTCQHMIERSGVRRFVDPVFLGAAIIVPPVRPGWAGADAMVMKQAAALAEKAFEDAGRPDISASDWELLMSEVVRSATA